MIPLIRSFTLDFRRAGRVKKDIKSRCAIIYISLFLIISLFPLVLMSAFGNQPVESSESEVAVPVFRNGEGRAAPKIGRASCRERV